MEIKPLPVYPQKPQAAILDMLKQAKQQLNLPYKISPEKAVPGSPGRVLAIQEKPNFICDYAYIANPNVESLTAALQWVLGLKEDVRGVTMGKMLSEYFGEGVKEIADDSTRGA